MNNYEILGLDQAAIANQDEKMLKKIINSAYPKQVKAIHPDVSGKVETDTQRVETTKQLVRLKDARDALVKDPLAIDDSVLRGGRYRPTHGETFTSVLDDQLQQFLDGLPPHVRGELGVIFGQMVRDAETNPTMQIVLGRISDTMREINVRVADAAHIKAERERNKQDYEGTENISDRAKARISLFRSTVKHRKPNGSAKDEKSGPKIDEKDLIERMGNRDFEAIVQLVNQTDFNTRHGARFCFRMFTGVGSAFIDAMEVLPPETTGKWGLREQPRAEDMPLYLLISKTDPNSYYGVKIVDDLIRFNYANPGYARGTCNELFRDLAEKVRAEVIRKTDFDTSNGLRILEALVYSNSLSSDNSGLKAVEAIVTKCAHRGRIQGHAALSFLGKAGLIDQKGQVISPRITSGNGAQGTSPTPEPVVSHALGD